jgi:hypothetical protein
MADEPPDLNASLRTGCQWLAEGLTDIGLALQSGVGLVGMAEQTAALQHIATALERQARALERQADAMEREVELRGRLAEESRAAQRGKR